MDIKSILKNRSSGQPPEIIAIKKYVADHFDGRSVGVSLSNSTIIIKVSSAAFAGSLKNHIRQLQIAADTTKRISFRIEG